jgi:hypothetical protein
MVEETLIVSIIIGYIFKGRLINLEKLNIKKIYLVFIGYGVETITIFLIKRGFLTLGLITLVLHLLMYIFLFAFIYFNRDNKLLILIGIGFLLNAIVIFSNGGLMPVGLKSLDILGFPHNVNSRGLYVLSESKTKFYFLSDIIPTKFPIKFSASIGDYVSTIGMGFLIILGMMNHKVK